MEQPSLTENLTEEQTTARLERVLQIPGADRPFEYIETVFVLGELMPYVSDLERYFRDSSSEIASAVDSKQRKINGLKDAIERYEKDKDKYHFFFFDRRDIHFEVTENNYKKVLQELERQEDFIKKASKVQRINHGKLMSILEDGADLESLELTNYAYYNHVVHIQYDTVPDEEGEEGFIRMRVFFNGDNYYHQEYGRSFAGHANHFEGVEAVVKRELGIDDADFPTLDEILSSGKPRRSKLRVNDPVFKIRTKGDEIEYSTTLTEAEVEMLRHCRGWCRPDHLYYGSGMWSPHQGKKITRNLFGIIGIYDKHARWRKNYYSDFFVPEENKEAVERAKKDHGLFVKTIKKESLPALAFIYDRTVELREQFGSRFYPRFTIKEVSERINSKKKKTDTYLEDLTGVLAMMVEPVLIPKDEDSFWSTSQTKWFIPRSRMKLVRDILHSQGLAD
jgi:hypothetical protein